MTAADAPHGRELRASLDDLTATQFVQFEDVFASLVARARSEEYRGWYPTGWWKRTDPETVGCFAWAQEHGLAHYLLDSEYFEYLRTVAIPMHNGLRTTKRRLRGLAPRIVLTPKWLVAYRDHVRYGARSARGNEGGRVPDTPRHAPSTAPERAAVPRKRSTRGQPPGKKNVAHERFEPLDAPPRDATPEEARAWREKHNLVSSVAEFDLSFLDDDPTPSRTSPPPPVPPAADDEVPSLEELRQDLFQTGSLESSDDEPSTFDTRPNRPLEGAQRFLYAGGREGRPTAAPGAEGDGAATSIADALARLGGGAAP
ncbi:MAG: hypothetical protein R3322_00075 [Kiloniellales bacterium]|nr:hypothetical protein [Kiloniellales bacterium]